MSEPQLKMWRHRLDDLPPLDLPEGYSLRVFQKGDEEAWAELMNRNAQLGDWNRERVENEFAGGVVRDGLYFITCEGKAVATACIDLRGSSEGECAAVGWVAVSPDYQGKRLGYHITLAALHGIRNLGYKAAFLWTDDFRLPAIKTYCNLGFEPDLTHESYPARWEAVRHQLSQTTR